CKAPRSSLRNTAEPRRAARRGRCCARRCSPARSSVIAKAFWSAAFQRRTPKKRRQTMTPFVTPFSRRAMLKSAAAGFGYLAFVGLSTWAAEKDDPLAPKKTHFPARAKHVIFLCMEGAPSHVDTFDYKPRLPELNGKTMPGARGFGGKVLASPW